MKGLNVKALVLTYTGYQDQEVIYPYYRLQGENFEVHLISDKKDSLGRTYGIFGVNMPCDSTYENFDSQEDYFLDTFDILILPGGVKSLEKLRQKKEVISFIKKWDRQEKVIGSTCHGAQLLISAKIVKGRLISGYYSIEDDIVNAGGTYSKIGRAHV